MKVEIINKNGYTWTFSTVEKAKPYIKKDRFQDYKIIDGVRVYDYREEIEEI